MSEKATTHHQKPADPAPAPTYAPAAYPQTQQPSGFAITALVLGIVSVTGFGLLTGIPAVIFGSLALNKKQHGRGMSIAGIVTGAVGTVLSLLYIAFIVIAIVIGSTNSTYERQYPTTDTDYYQSS